MAVPTKFDGTLGNPVGKTSFGYFDGDPDFIKDAPKIADWIARRLGWPTVDIEIDEKDLYNSIEEAILEFSRLVNHLNIKDNLIILQGNEKIGEYENLTGKHVTGSPVREMVRLAKAYGSEVGHGGSVTWRKDFINIKRGKQRYDIKKLFKEKNRSGSVPIEDREIIIKKIYYYPPHAIERLYDPFSVGGVGTLNVLRELGFSDYGVASEYLMMPAYHDLLRLQAVEFNDLIRRSGYTYRLTNGVLTITPIPGTEDFFGGDAIPENDDNEEPNRSFPRRIWFDYVFKDEANNVQVVDSDIANVVSDYSDVPYDVHHYEDINQPSRRWIYKYALEVARHKLGTVRSKYGNSIPGTNGADLQLDGESQKQEAQQNMEQLENNLREQLEQLSRTNLLEEQNQQQQNLQEMMNRIPKKIYIGYGG
jgi:hypothetical protein